MPAPVQPTWTQPASQGLLSNKRGSDTGSDAIALIAKYINPADAAGTIRATATRISTGTGAVTADTLFWDSGWTGTPTATTMPAFPAQANSAPWTTCNWPDAFGGPRIYAASSNGTRDSGSNYATQIMSASLIGGSVGAWRIETPIRFWFPKNVDTSPCSSLTFVYNYGQPMLYAVSDNNTIAYASLNPDGTINPWRYSTSTPAAPGQLYGNITVDASFQGWLGVVGDTSGIGQAAVASTNVQHVGLNQDGSLQSWVADAALPAARGNFGFHIDLDGGYIVVAGGHNGTSAQTSIYTASINTLGLISAWSTQTNALPTAKAALGLVVENGYIFALGGSTGTSATNGTTTLHSATISRTVGTSQIGSWTSKTPALPVAMSYGSWFLGQTGAMGSFSYLIVAGATDTSGGQLATYENLDSGSGGLVGGSWNTGVATLTAGDLGTGGALTANQDGSTSVTYRYSAFGVAPIISGGFSDGDEVAFTVQFTDSALGLASPVATTAVVRIGQPPTITASSPANASTPAGAFTAVFTYAAGAGGGPELSWRIQEQQPAATTIADSGVTYGSANTFPTRPALALASNQIPGGGAAGAVVFTANSTDSPYPGSSASATATNSVTYTGTPPAVPTGVTATADNTNGWVTVTWTNPGGGTAAATNRIWYRVNGTNPWYLARDNIASLLTPQSLQVMEPLALKVLYDFGVSAVSAAPTESAIGTS